MPIFQGTVDQIENTKNKVTSIGKSPTDAQYPTAKAVRSAISTHDGTSDVHDRAFTIHNNDSDAHQPLKDYSDGKLIAHNTNSESHADIRAEIEDMHAVNRIRLDAPLSVDSTGKQLTVKIAYYGGDDPRLITATQVLLSTYHDANCIRYINLSHDLDAGEVVNVTADRDPEGWTSIANITIANGMWQLSSVIWLDDILFHNADENAHPALKEHSDSAIAAHNTNSEAHEDIRESISAFFHNIVTGCNVRMGGTWTYDKITGKTTVALSPDSATTTCYFPAQFPSGAQTAYVHFEDLPDGAKIDMRAWYSGADYYYFGRITADGVYQIDLSKFAGENGERTLLLETDSSKTFTFYITEKSDEALSENIRIGELEQNLSTTKAGVKILSNSMCAYSITHGVNLDDNGQEMSASNYSVLDGYIDIRNGVIFPYEKNIRWVWFYDEEFNAKERSEGVNNVTETQLSTYPYMRLSFLSTTIEGADVDLGTYSKVDILNRAFEMSQYRYLATAFGGRDGGTGMFILGSNDLRRFKCLNPMYPFHPSENEGIRDPSVMFIDGWYYVVYSNMQWISVTNELGLCRTKDFVTWEELPNLVVTPSNGDDLTNGYCWAPAFFREGDDCYIIVAGATDPSTQNFYHRIMSFDPDTATVSEAYTTNITFIDCHIYKENGMYYALGSQGALWKSDILLSDTWTKIENAQNPLYFIHYEGQFAIRKDDGNWRVFGQNVYNESDNVLDNLYYYQDGGSSLESDFEDRQVISYDAETLNFAESKWQGVTNKAIFSHFTIYDRNCWMDNNNRFA